jgi:fimbrial chaperone protein
MTRQSRPLAYSLAFATCLASLAAGAGQFSVSPVRIYMTARDRATAITITNDAQEELVMQAELFEWKQRPDGEDDLTPTEDLFVSPPIIKLAPGARQVVRLARVKATPTNDQLTYRVFLREIAEARPPTGLEVQLALTFSLPIFITPPTAKAALDCGARRAAADVVRVECGNGGNAYVNAREFTLLGGDGRKLATRDSGGYLLPGSKRSFELKRAEGAIPGGPAKVTVLLDDGSTKSFDVQLNE